MSAGLCWRSIEADYTQGHRVVLFEHDEFVIEIPADHAKVDEALVKKIVGLVQSAASEVVGLPVLCEATVSSCWSKAAQRLPTRRGRIPVWSPE